MKKVSNIFEHTNCIPEETLLKYISDKLSPAQKHEVEKHLIDCELCSDAAEGFKLVDTKKIPSIISELNQKNQTRISRIDAKEVKIVFLRQYRTQLAVAASLLLIVGLVWFFKSNISMKELDSTSSEKIFADQFEPPPSQSLTSPAEPQQLSEPEKINPVPVEHEPAQEPKASKSDGKYRDADELSKSKKTLGNENRTEEVPEKDSDKKSQASSAIVSTTQSAAGKPNQSVVAKMDTASTSLKEVEVTMNNTQADEDAVLSDKSAPKSKLKQEKKEPIASDNNLSGYFAAKPAATPAPEPNARAVQKPETSFQANYSVSLMAPDSAMIKYDKQDYAGASYEFEKELKQNPGDEKTLFYSGVSYLSTGETDKAITNFSKVLQNKDGEYYDSAQWYLSLAYIKKKDTENARKNLTELKNNSKSKYQKQADETLKEMNK